MYLVRFHFALLPQQCSRRRTPTLKFTIARTAHSTRMRKSKLPIQCACVNLKPLDLTVLAYIHRATRTIIPLQNHMETGVVLMTPL